MWRIFEDQLNSVDILSFHREGGVLNSLASQNFGVTPDDSKVFLCRRVWQRSFQAGLAATRLVLERSP